MFSKKIGNFCIREYDKPRLVRFLMVLIVRIYIRVFLVFRVNREFELPKGPKIYAPNHPTATDPFIIASMFPNAKMLLTKLVFVKGTTKLLTKLGYIPVDIQNGKLAYNSAKGALLKGKDIILFPEGGYSEQIYTMNEIKTGLVRLALETNATIVPIGINIREGSAKVRKIKNEKGEVKTFRWYMFDKYYVNIGEGIKITGDVQDREFVSKKSDEVKERIQNLSREFFYNK